MKNGWKTATMLAAGIVFGSGSAHASEKCSIQKILTFPVTIIDRQATVPVSLDGHKTHMILDSGAFFSMIPMSAADEFDFRLNDVPYGMKVTGIGGDTDVKMTTLKDVTLGGQTIHHVDFLVGGSETGQSGLIGQNVLGFADTEYDLPDGTVRLMRISKGCGNSNLAYWARSKPYSEIDLRTRHLGNDQIFGTVEIDGVKLRAMFDTGAGASILTQRAAEKLGFDPHGAGVEQAGPEWGVGSRQVQTWIAPFAELQLGNGETIKNVHLRVGAIDDANFDMLIGADFFLSHRVFVANGLSKMFFTYEGGPVFDLSRNQDSPRPGKIATAEASSPDGVAAKPMTAEQFSGRGSAEFTRHQFAAAKSDLDRAITMAPNIARYHLQRAKIEVAMKDNDAVKQDLDAAITLDPKDADAILFRAEQRIRAHDMAGAVADADRADDNLSQQSDDRLDLGDIYDAAGRPKKAIENYERWTKAHPTDGRMAMAENSLCWVRMLNGIDADEAIHDCNRALRLNPHNPQILDSRGWAYLRGEKPKRAIEDYDAALAIAPKQASSLYGRGLAKRRLGDTAAGDLDIAAAKAINENVAKPFDEHGITH